MLTSTSKAVAAQSNPAVDDSQSNQALCLPGLETPAALNCLLAGPAGTLQDLVKQGIFYPAEPLALANPTSDLYSIPFSYAKVLNTAVPIYASVADAQNNVVKDMLAAGKFKYIAYSQKVSNENGTFYQIATGDWINADVITKVSIPHFQGFLIKKFPSVPFGWVLQDADTYKAPGASEKTGKQYHRLDLVLCYASQTVNNIEWVMISPNEWIEHRLLARAINNPTPPEGVTNGRWIEINLYEQVLTVYDQGKMIFATLISTGVEPFYTQPGKFQIYKKIEHEYMTGAFEADHSDYYYLEEVPYIMYYDQSRALHGAYWNTLYGYQRSHGCVNLSVEDAHWLYNWANEGETVYVWDPSGKTPTDPALYGAGGF